MTTKGVNSENTNSTEGGEGDTRVKESSSGVSPYATGGGGVTFERKVAVQYLAHLLVGDGAVEFGEGSPCRKRGVPAGSGPPGG